MTEPNQFRFVNAGSAVRMTVLNAVMSDFSYGNHAHEELALGVTREGLQDFSCNGEQFRSHPGEIVLLNPGDVHNGNPGNGAPLKYTMLYLAPDEFLPLMGCAADSDRTEFRIPGAHFNDPVLRALILDVARLAARAKGGILEREHGLYGLAARLTCRMGLYRPDAWSARKDPLLLRARDYVHDNIAGEISISDLSRVANLSKFHFIRLFRTQFGLTPHQYILNHRINRARAALAAGTPPSDVAQALGFFDVSHLNRLFKRSCGLTPGRYQHQLLK